MKESVEIINENISNINQQIMLNELDAFEIGSNTGLLSQLLAKYFKSWHGVERHRPFLNFLKNDSKLKYSKGWLDENLPVLDNSQSYIICNNIMKYTDNLNKYFTILENILKKNGLVLIVEHDGHNFLTTRNIKHCNKDKLKNFEHFLKNQDFLTLLFKDKYESSNYYVLKNKK